MKTLQQVIASWCVGATCAGIATLFAGSTAVAGAENARRATPGDQDAPTGHADRRAYETGGATAVSLLAGPGDPPSPAETMRAYRIVDQWVRGWSVPEPLGAGAAGATASGGPAIGGASVVLRLDGEVVGRGSRLIEPGENISGNEAIRQAVSDAFSETERKAKVDNDALRAEKVRSLAERVQISLELAGPLIPIDVRTFDQAEQELAPGLDGVAVRIGKRTSSSFPGTMLSNNTSVRMGLSRAASQAGNDPKLSLDEPNVLIEKHGARLYRFRVSHLAQTARGASPIFLLRGGQIIEQAEVTTKELREMADRVAEHLLTLAWEGKEAYGMTGGYDAANDRSDARFAGPIEQLTAAYALRRYAQSGSLPPARSLELRGFSDRILRDLKTIEPGELVPWEDPVASALWIVVASLDPVSATGAQRTAYPEECKRIVLTSFSALVGYGQNVPPGARGLVALALVELAAREQAGGLQDEAVGLAEAAVRRVYRETPDGQLVSTMPWLGWAELRLGQVKGEGAGDDIPAAVALRQMRESVWEHQVGPLADHASESRGGLPDVVGGVSFGPVLAAGSGVNWQTAQAVAFLPAMLADARLTPAAERPLEIANLLRSMRFLRQLQADGATEWMFENRAKSLGGIRAATWDQRMPTDASSMTLLAVSEMLRVLEKLSRR
ncbi:MAG: hypothetical protein H7210_00080 [Pyrinomonadaceae bacterium]|nr:hypothetical protein [Phycisphaerales bacterium]